MFLQRGGCHGLGKFSIGARPIAAREAAAQAVYMGVKKSKASCIRTAHRVVQRAYVAVS